MEQNFNVDRRFKIYSDKLTSIHANNNLIIETSNHSIDFSCNTLIFDGQVVLNRVICNNITISNVSEISSNFVYINNIYLPKNIKLKYNSVNDGYIRNISVGYSPQDDTLGRSDAYFTYINVSGSDSSFNTNLYINKDLIVDGTLTISNDLLISGTNFTSIEISFNMYKSELAQSFSSTKIFTKDMSTSNISISNDLYVHKTAYINDISISGQLLNSVLKVPNIFTIDPSGHGNASGTLIINGDLIVKGVQTSIASSIVDICDLAITLASNLANRLDLSNTNAGLDISNVASLKYNGTTWNFSGGQLTVENKKVMFLDDVSSAKFHFDLSVNAYKTDFSSSFFTLKRNIDNSYNATYTRFQIDNSFILKSNFDLSSTSLRSYVNSSYISRRTLDGSFEDVLTLMDMSYVARRRVGSLNSFDSSFASFTEKLDMSYILNSVFDVSHNKMKIDFDNSFASINKSVITIETINTPTNKTLSLIPSSTTINTTISGDLIVGGNASLKSFRISNKHIFDVSINGYSSNYFATTDVSASIVDYYSNVGYTYNRVFRIDACGNITNYSNQYGGASDSRLKKNIVNCSPKLEKMLKVRVVNYNLKGSDKTKYIGVLAQELEELFPELVAEDNTHERIKSVNYSTLTIMLIKAFQEQQVLINNLNTALEDLDKYLEKDLEKDEENNTIAH